MFISFPLFTIKFNLKFAWLMSKGRKGRWVVCWIFRFVFESLPPSKSFRPVLYVARTHVQDFESTRKYICIGNMANNIHVYTRNILYREVEQVRENERVTSVYTVNISMNLRSKLIPNGLANRSSSGNVRLSSSYVSFGMRVSEGRKGERESKRGRESKGETTRSQPYIPPHLASSLLFPGIFSRPARLLAPRAKERTAAYRSTTYVQTINSFAARDALTSASTCVYTYRILPTNSRWRRIRYFARNQLFARVLTACGNTRKSSAARLFSPVTPFFSLRNL